MSLFFLAVFIASGGVAFTYPLLLSLQCVLSPSCRVCLRSRHLTCAAERTGVDFSLDVHGDESIPYNFFAGPEGIPSYNKRIERIYKNYTQYLLDRSPDFQTAYGYPKNAPGTANLKVCSNYIAEHFKCVAITVEQPFKDSDITPMPAVGWSPQRAKHFGAACLAACVPLLSDLE